MKTTLEERLRIAVVRIAALEKRLRKQEALVDALMHPPKPKPVVVPQDVFDALSPTDIERTEASYLAAKLLLGVQS